MIGYRDTTFCASAHTSCLMTSPDGRVIGTATPRILEYDRDYENGYRTDTPAYDAGYLLRELPLRFYIRRHKEAHADWWAYRDSLIVLDKYGEGILADTPEDCLTLLAIRLFEQGILKKEING